MTVSVLPAPRRTSPRALLLVLLLPMALSACERRAAAGPINGDPSKVVLASPGRASSNPLPGVIPLGDAMPAAKTNSPADGTVAVGGMSDSHSNGGAAPTGGMPAKTSGDGK